MMKNLICQHAKNLRFFSMKNIMMLFIIIILISVSYAVVLEAENDTEKILITLINQEPDPVVPGDVVELKFRFENRRSLVLEEVKIRIVEVFPFRLYSNEIELKSIGTLAPNQKGDTGVRFVFKVFVDPNAAEGDNEFILQWTTNDGIWRTVKDFNIDIRSRDPILSINEIITSPEKIAPGSVTNVKFILENLAGSVLKDIRLKLDLYTQLTTTSSITFRELPFTPIGSSNEKTIHRIIPGTSDEIYFNLFTDSTAETKVYKVPYILTYSDEAGTNFSRTGIVGLIVDFEPDLSISLDETNIYSTNTKGVVTIKFVNKGFGDLKFLNVYLKETQKFDLVSSSEVYIGNVDSDDYETADFEIITAKDAGNEVLLPITIEYRDGNGKLYTREISMSLELFRGSALKQRLDGKGNFGVGIIIVIVIVGVGILYYRKRKKKKLR